MELKSCLILYTYTSLPEDKLVVERARKVQKMLSQPFFMSEVFSGKPGKFCALEDTLDAFNSKIAFLKKI